MLKKKTKEKIIQEIVDLIQGIITFKKDSKMVELSSMTKKFYEPRDIFIKKVIPVELVGETRLLQSSQIRVNSYEKLFLLISIATLFNTLYTTLEKSGNNKKLEDIDIEFLEDIVERVTNSIEQQEGGDNNVDMRALIAELEDLPISYNHPLYKKIRELLKRLKYRVSGRKKLVKVVVYIILILLLSVVLLNFYKQLRNQLMGLQSENKMLNVEVEQLRLNAMGLLATADKLIKNNKMLLDLIADYELYEKKALEAKVAGLSQSENLMNIFMKIKNFVMDLVRFKSQDWQSEEIQDLELLSDEIIGALYEMNKYWDKFI
jgi:hypothetical protein